MKVTIAILLCSAAAALAQTRPNRDGINGASSSGGGGSSGSAASFTASGSAPQFITTTSGTSGLSTQTSAATMSSSVPAFELNIANTPTNLSDLIFAVTWGAFPGANTKMSLTKGGDLTLYNGMTIANNGTICGTTPGQFQCLKLGTSLGPQLISGASTFTLDSISISHNGMKVPVFHTSSANQQAFEVGKSAMTAGALAVTFGTAFSAAPACTCTHVNTTNGNPCVISVDSSTTAVTFAVLLGATDVVHWHCVGDR